MAGDRAPRARRLDEASPRAVAAVKEMDWRELNPGCDHGKVTLCTTPIYHRKSATFSSCTPSGGGITTNTTRLWETFVRVTRTSSVISPKTLQNDPHAPHPNDLNSEVWEFPQGRSDRYRGSSYRRTNQSGAVPRSSTVSFAGYYLQLCCSL